MFDPNDPENQATPDLGNVPDPRLFPNVAAPTAPQPAPPAGPEDMRAALFAQLQQKLAPQAPVDTSAADAEAQRKQKLAMLIQSGTQIGQALSGKSGDGTNGASTLLNSQAQAQLAQGLLAKKNATEAEQKRQELIQALGGKFVDQDAQSERQSNQQEFQSGENVLNRDLDREKLREQIQGRKETAQIAREGKLVDQDTKDAQKLQDDLDPNKARGGNLAKNQELLNQADRLKVLYTESNGDLRNLDSRQMEELAIGMNKLLSGSSSGSVTQVQALLPHTAVGDSQKLKEWLMNDPRGVNQQAFVSRMAETIEREHTMASDKVKEAQAARLGAHGRLKERSPDTYNQILNNYGISPDMLDEKGHYKPATQDKQAAPKLSPEDQQAIDWAKANPNDPRAAQIIKLHGG